MTMPKSALWPGTAKHWICSGAPGGLAREDAAEVFDALSLAIARGDQRGQPRPVDPVEQMEKMPALLRHERGRDLLRRRRSMSVLHRAAVRVVRAGAPSRASGVERRRHCGRPDGHAAWASDSCSIFGGETAIGGFDSNPLYDFGIGDGKRR